MAIDYKFPNKYLVRRTHSIHNGENVSKTMYAVLPRDMNGTEYFSEKIEDAWLFSEEQLRISNYLHPSFGMHKKSNRDGDSKYVQDLVVIELVVSDKRYPSL